MSDVQRFFPGETALADEFASSLPANELSMAQLQGHLLAHKTSARLAVSTVSRLLEDAKPVAVDSTTVFAHFRRAGLELLAPYFEHHVRCVL
jgi:hypothetical protein